MVVKVLHMFWLQYHRQVQDDQVVVCFIAERKTQKSNSESTAFKNR